MVEPTTDHVWVWDGPAIDYPMGPSIMGLGEGTRYFHAKNVMFLFAETTEFALNKLKEFKRVVCDVKVFCLIHFNSRCSESPE